jgi:undecaprenyl pyrophosphate phosphatase UppP
MKCFFVKYYNNNSFWLVLILLGSIVNVYLTYLDRDFYRYNNNNLKEEEEEEDIYDFKYNAGIRDATILFTVVGIIPCHYK